MPQSGHFLPLVLIKEIVRSFEHAESDLAVSKAAFTLKQILTKHEYDSRYVECFRLWLHGTHLSCFLCLLL